MNCRRLIIVTTLNIAACSASDGAGADAALSFLADASVVDASFVDAGPPDAEVPLCQPGFIECGVACIDPLTDGNFCGATTCSDDATDGIVCEEGSECDGSGGCAVFACPTGSFTATCDPVLQTGCQAGEKCARIVESAAPFLARTTCLPEGQVKAGGGCTTCGTLPEWDNCEAGAACVAGLCRTTCTFGTSGSCRDGTEAFNEGEYCDFAEEGFGGSVGFCFPACDPTNDTIQGGSAVHSTCDANEGCYLNTTSGGSTCQRVPMPATTVTQNQDCHGPATGGCFRNGCASGFVPMLNNHPVDADGTVCARYCTPVVTHTGAQASAAGANGNCETTTLGAIGGTNGETSAHQCRFIETFYSNTDNVPEEVGMCVPVTLEAGGAWGDCTILNWDGIKSALNGVTPIESFNNLCLETPEDPMNSDIKDVCIGFFKGCLSAQEKAAGIP